MRRVVPIGGALARIAWALLAVGASELHAERLPITTYGPADGLPSTFIEHVTRDSRGFLWFSTRDGLSRFDGVRFLTYGVEHGLPNPTINALLETRAGDYWVATNGGGVCRMQPAAPMPPAAREGAPLFTCHAVGTTQVVNRVNVLHEDARGRVWIGTDGGLFRIDAPRGPVQLRQIPLNLPFARAEGVHALLEDRAGVLWVGVSWGLVRVAPDGGRSHMAISASPGGDNVYALHVDDDGRLWMGHQTGLIVLKPARPLQTTSSGPTPTQRLAGPSRALPLDTAVSLPEREGEAIWYTLHEGRFEVPVNALQVTADGHLWIGTGSGLMEFDRQRFRRYTTAEGLGDTFIVSLTTDADRNLWSATRTGGAMKLTRNGFRSYDTRDGLGHPQIHALFEDRAGTLFAVSGDWIVNRFDGARFTHGQPRLVPDTHPAWNSQVAFLDRTDRWWILTSSHLSRLPSGSPPAHLARLAPEVVESAADPNILYEDRRGDIWIGLRYTRPDRLLTWRRDRDVVQTWTAADGAPADEPTAFVEDAAGHLWIGLRNGDFARYHDGRFTRFQRPPGSGLPGSGPPESSSSVSGPHAPGPQESGPRRSGEPITSLYRDDRGRLWAGSTTDGVIRIDAPDSPTPRFTVYSKADGLGSNNVRSVVGDRWGRIYVGTARGVDRIDPDTHRVQHYATGDGLLSGFVNVAYRDRADALWFGSPRGLSRLLPEPVERRDPPRVFISSVRAAGTPHLMSHLGQAEVDGLRLQPGEGQLQIEFFGLAFGMGESLRYQYRLDGADDRDRWSDASAERTVHYSRLPPRAYRFQVRAVRADGTPSTRAATVAFEVLPALWQRAWFQALVLALVAGAGYRAYHVRVSRLLALERVRSRIAGDLHDDIGATLAQIAVLSEVVQTQIDDAHAPLRAPVARIAQTAREAIASMSDIVWAINPQRDSLQEMVRRMRRFASEVLPPRGITFRITAPDGDVRLGADVRRHSYLIFKEAVNNILRHADCSEVTIALRVVHRQLQLEIADNGRGFTVRRTGDAGEDPEASAGQSTASEGNGLVSMTRRATALGGALDVESGQGRQGTTVTARIPLGRAA